MSISSAQNFTNVKSLVVNAILNFPALVGGNGGRGQILKKLLKLA